jgi:predicted Rdx family selenoprotein
MRIIKKSHKKERCSMNKICSIKKSIRTSVSIIIISCFCFNYSLYAGWFSLQIVQKLHTQKQSMQEKTQQTNTQRLFNIIHVQKKIFEQAAKTAHMNTMKNHHTHLTHRVDALQKELRRVCEECVRLQTNYGKNISTCQVDKQSFDVQQKNIIKEINLLQQSHEITHEQCLNLQTTCALLQESADTYQRELAAIVIEIHATKEKLTKLIHNTQHQSISNPVLFSAAAENNTHTITFSPETKIEDGSSKILKKKIRSLSLTNQNPTRAYLKKNSAAASSNLSHQQAACSNKPQEYYPYAPIDYATTSAMRRKPLSS